MGFVVGFLAVIAVLSSLVLMFVILIQEPKGGGIAAALGGSGMEAIGPAVGNVNRFTSWLAGVWMVVCFAHALWMEQSPMPVAKEEPAKEAEKSGEKPSEGEKPPEPPK